MAPTRTIAPHAAKIERRTIARLDAALLRAERPVTLVVRAREFVGTDERVTELPGLVFRPLLTLTPLFVTAWSVSAPRSIAVTLTSKGQHGENVAYSIFIIATSHSRLLASALNRLSRSNFEQVEYEGRRGVLYVRRAPHIQLEQTRCVFSSREIEVL